MKRIVSILLLAFLVFGCEDENNDTIASGEDGNVGQGGSLTTFTLYGDYLYVVDESDLNVFSLLNSNQPILVNKVPVGFNIETLFGFKDDLYIGSRNGMFIYSLDDPEFPRQLSEVQHFTACDPVVANDTLAFVTLHSNTFCGNDINLLEIYDIKNPTDPVLVSSRNLVQPKGLGLYKNYVIVCDDEIKIFDFTNPSASRLVNSINQQAFDVIIRGDNLIAIGEAGLYQYRLQLTQDGVGYQELSTISI